MLRSIFEKIPSFITKTDVWNPQVSHHLIRPLSKVKRSCSCVEGGLGTRISKYSLAGQENYNGDRKRNMDVVHTKSAASNNVSFYKTTPRGNSNNPQYKLHRSRYSLDEDIPEHRTYQRYRLEAARPRRSRSELSISEFGEFDFLKLEEDLQPRNLKPFRTADDAEFSLPIIPKRLALTKNLSAAKYIDEPGANHVSRESETSEKMLMNEYLQTSTRPMNEAIDLNAVDTSKFEPRYEYSTYSNYIPRPSYSEYVNSKRTTTKQDVTNKRSNCNISKTTEENFDTVCERVANKEFKYKKVPFENIPDQINANENVVETSSKAAKIFNTTKSSLRRLFTKRGHTVPCYSEYIKTQTTKPIVTVPNREAHKVDSLGLDKNSQRGEFSSTHSLNIENSGWDNSNSYEDSDYLPPKRSSSNCRAKSSTAVSGLFLSKSTQSVSLIPSRTFVICPAYSDFLKISIKKKVEIEPNKDTKPLLTSKSVNSLDVFQRCPLSTKKLKGNKFEPPTIKAIKSLNESLQKRQISSSETHVLFSRRNNENNRYQPLINGNGNRNFMLKAPDMKSYSSKKKCKPKKDPCEPKKPSKCFLPSTVRLPPYKKCSPKYKPCPIGNKCPPRADDCLCVKPKKLPTIHPVGCICIEPYIPEKAPALKRLKFVAPDPPRVCPEPMICMIPRADDTLVERPKKLKPYKPKPCDCIEPPPLVDVPLIRLKKMCEPEEICYPAKPCPSPPPCIRADDNLCVKPKKLPVLATPICPCIEETVKEAPALKRLNLKSPEPPRICPKPCVCDVDCPRADDNLVTKVKPLPPIKAGDCPCVDTEIVDVEFKRLKCIEEPEECIYTDPCDVPQPRADFGCWEYYTPEPEPICREVKIKTKKPCKKTKKMKMNR